jgi:amidohydrolase
LEKIKQLVQQEQNYLIGMRRHFRMNPEVGEQEVMTQQRIIEELTAMGLEPKKCAGTGIIAELKGNMPGKTVAIRADIDALPIQDEIDKEYKSKIAGACHACGHDAHMAMLLTEARILCQLKDELRGNIRFIFQPAEEKFPGGARKMIAEGAMENVDFVLGTHVWQPLKAGLIGVSYGRVMAAPDQFEITVQGTGGHGSMPQDTICALSTAAQIVCTMNTIIGRNVNPLEPAVVSFGMIQSGKVFNITPDTATIIGTVRSFDQNVRMRVWERIDQVCNGVCESMGATYTIEKIFGYPPVINNPDVAAVVAEAGREAAGADRVVEVGPSMGGEDYSYYLEKVPGMFLYLGIGNPDKDATFPHHHPKFDLDEDALIAGVETMVRAALKLQAK